jgi:hypothetical protein
MTWTGREPKAEVGEGGGDGGGLAVAGDGDGNSARAVSLARDPSLALRARGRPHRPVRAVGSSYRAASLRSRVVQVIPGASLCSSFPA